MPDLLAEFGLDAELPVYAFGASSGGAMAGDQGSTRAVLGQYYAMAGNPPAAAVGGCSRGSAESAPLRFIC